MLFIGKSGGFIFVYILVVFAAGWLLEKIKEFGCLYYVWVFLIGIVVIYIIGMIYMYIVLKLWFYVLISYGMVWFYMIWFFIKDIILVLLLVFIVFVVYRFVYKVMGFN